MTFLPTFAVLAVMLGAIPACTSDAPETRPEAVRPTTAQPLPAPTSDRLTSKKPVKSDGRHRFFAVSAEVEQGVPYRFEINGHCGLDWRVDFDGSLWMAVHVPRWYQDGENLSGTMRLENEEQARFETPEGRHVRFIRHAGKTFRHLCD